MSRLQDKINALYAGAAATNSADDWRALVDLLMPKPKAPKARKGKSRWVPVSVTFVDSHIITLTVSIPENGADDVATARASNLARQFRAHDMAGMAYQRWLATHGAEIARLRDSGQSDLIDAYYAAHPAPEREPDVDYVWRRNAAGRMVKLLSPRYADMVPPIESARVLASIDMSERALWRGADIHPDHALVAGLSRAA
jgi:hypothetical protein